MVCCTFYLENVINVIEEVAMAMSRGSFEKAGVGELQRIVLWRRVRGYVKLFGLLCFLLLQSFDGQWIVLTLSSFDELTVIFLGVVLTIVVLSISCWLFFPF